jgi:hypothetical protein
MLDVARYANREDLSNFKTLSIAHGLEYGKELIARLGKELDGKGVPSNLGDVLDLAMKYLDDRLSFVPGFKEAALSSGIPHDDADICKIVWRMFLSMARRLHPMVFKLDNASREMFMKLEGCAIITLDSSDKLPDEPGAVLTITDLKVRDVLLRFSFLRDEKKILCHELVPGDTPLAASWRHHR